MRCQTCGNGDRRPARRPYVAQKNDRLAVVTDVPVEECPACGQTWYDEEVALRLDAILNQMLATELVAVRPYDPTSPATAA